MDPFVPQLLPLDCIDWARLVPIIAAANESLGRYDGCLRGLVNKEILLSRWDEQEAVLSARIEGTVTTLGEVLEFGVIGAVHGEARDDLREVLNYGRALRAAATSLGERPFGIGLIKDAHRLLLDSARGRDKTPGSVRRGQNYLVARGPDGEQEVRYTPPHPIHVASSLENLETYFHHAEQDTISHCGIIHAQFEIIHPFEDGNGRIGRMLVPLFLYWKRKLVSPSLYVSAYLQEHRDEYYARLAAIESSGEWTEWLQFFVGAVRNQAEENCRTAMAIHELYEDTKRLIDAKVHTQFALRVLDALFHFAVFQSRDFCSYTDIRRPTAQVILRLLRGAGIISVPRPKSGRRPAIYRFDKLVQLLAAQGTE